MKVKIITLEGNTVEIDEEVFSHALVSHRLNLYEWEKREKAEFVKFIQLASTERAAAERKLKFLYDELEKINLHHRQNRVMCLALNTVLTPVRNPHNE